MHFPTGGDLSPGQDESHDSQTGNGGAIPNDSSTTNGGPSPNNSNVGNGASFPNNSKFNAGNGGAARGFKADNPTPPNGS